MGKYKKKSFIYFYIYIYFYKFAGKQCKKVMISDFLTPAKQIYIWIGQISIGY